jgi:hypothetical protein
MRPHRGSDFAARAVSGGMSLRRNAQPPGPRTTRTHLATAAKRRRRWAGAGTRNRHVPALPPPPPPPSQAGHALDHAHRTDRSHALMGALPGNALQANGRTEAHLDPVPVCLRALTSFAPGTSEAGTSGRVSVRASSSGEGQSTTSMPRMSEPGMGGRRRSSSATLPASPLRIGALGAE